MAFDDLLKEALAQKGYFRSYGSRLHMKMRTSLMRPARNADLGLVSEFIERQLSTSWGHDDVAAAIAGWSDEQLACVESLLLPSALGTLALRQTPNHGVALPKASMWWIVKAIEHRCVREISMAYRTLRQAVAIPEIPKRLAAVPAFRADEVRATRDTFEPGILSHPFGEIDLLRAAYLVASLVRFDAEAPAQLDAFRALAEQKKIAGFGELVENVQSILRDPSR